MKTIEIEGIRLTEDMIRSIHYFQEENCNGLNHYLRLIDKTVQFVAINSQECLNDRGQKEALDIICKLYLFREVLSEFSGKEEQQ